MPVERHNSIGHFSIAPELRAPLAVVSFDLDGLVTSWNPAAEKIFGFRESDVLGKTIPIVPHEYLAEHKRLLKSTLVGSVTSATETIRQRLDGSRIPVSISAAPSFGSDGKLQSAIDLFTA